MKKIYFPKKILQIMRMSFLLLFACFLNISASTYSQKFSFNTSEDKTIKDILAEIETESNFKFLYRTDLVDVSRTVRLNVNDADITTVLETILQPSEMTYRIFNDSLVVITNKASMAQHKITGTVIDAKTGEPLAGVTIIIDGTTKGFLTNASGKYSLEVSDSDVSLSFFIYRIFKSTSTYCRKICN